MGIVVGWMLFWGAVLLYLAPSIVASQRKHRAIGSIFVINLLLGWTLLVWVLCLAWSVGPNVATAQAETAPGSEEPSAK